MSSFLLQAAAVCHQGRVRKNNEDNLYFDKHILAEIHDGIQEGYWITAGESGQPKLYGVFDGMGGHAKGEVASYIAADTARKAVEEQVAFDGLSDADEVADRTLDRTGKSNNSSKEMESEQIFALLKAICQDANKLVCQEMEEAKSRVGTTGSMLYFYKSRYYLCNIGDSPIYLVRGGEATPVFEEHTERLMNERLYGKEKTKGKKYPLTQHIGIFPEEMTIEPYVTSGAVQAGDIYLICSDGLTDMVVMDEILEIIQECNELPEVVLRLQEKALENGGRDNITIIAIRALAAGTHSKTCENKSEKSEWMGKRKSSVEDSTTNPKINLTENKKESKIAKFWRKLTEY